MSVRFSGAVLAGGASRRMGVDKALLRTDGELWWRRQVRQLRAAGAESVAVIRRPDQANATLFAGVPLLHDTLAGIGAIAGLHAALTAHMTAHVAILAIDMPLANAAWFRRLLGRCRPGVGAVGVHDDGYEPLAAIYPRGAASVVAEHIRRGENSLRDLVRTLVADGLMEIEPLSIADGSLATNCNTPADFARIAHHRGAGSVAAQI